MSAVFLQVEECSFGYRPGQEILKNLSFGAQRGEIVAVLGCNGVGKTTLLKCLAGIMPWSGGRCTLDGKRLRGGRCLGYVAQAKRMAFAYEVADLVAFGRTALNPYFAAPSAEDRRASMRTLELLDIGHLARRSCMELSGGELQMVCIAKALVGEPKLLILDEPEANLDVRNQSHLVGILRALAEEKGTTVVFNSHSLDHVSRLAQWCLLLGRGGDYLFGRPETILTREILAKYFETPVVDLPYVFDGREFRSFVFL